MRLFTNNWRLKLAALFIASSTWGVVAYADNPVDARDFARVAIQAGPLANNNWVIVNQLPPVAITITGLHKGLATYDPKNLHAVIDLGRARIGLNEVPVEVDDADPSVTVTRVVPDRVSVVLDEKETVVRKLELPRDLTVKNNPNGCCQAQNSLASASPDSVALTGPKSLLAKAIPYVEVDVAQATADVVQAVDVKLKGLDARGQSLVTVNPPQVKVTVPIKRVKKQVPAAVKPKKIGSPAAGYQITDIRITPDTVTAEGDPGIVANVTSIDTAAVNISGATSDVIQTVGLQPPQGVTVTDATQVTVHYFIGRIPDVQPSPSPNPSPVPSPSPSR